MRSVRISWMLKILQWNSMSLLYKYQQYSKKVCTYRSNRHQFLHLRYLKKLEENKVRLKFIFIYWLSITIFICVVPYISFKKITKRIEITCIRMSIFALCSKFCLVKDIFFICICFALYFCYVFFCFVASKMYVKCLSIHPYLFVHPAH